MVSARPLVQADQVIDRRDAAQRRNDDRRARRLSQDTPMPLATSRSSTSDSTSRHRGATQTLADLGAEVVKVESPAGDQARRVGTYGHAIMRASTAAGSVVLDLRDPAGSRARRLVARPMSWCRTCGRVPWPGWDCRTRCCES
ncbi:hypothetical protein HBB16_20475 [Pseudonocardia sp. MCCB 268]|nr:hypothetical protein [Pseudonocardia cytotoxica]